MINRRRYSRVCITSARLFLFRSQRLNMRAVQTLFKYEMRIVCADMGRTKSPSSTGLLHANATGWSGALTPIHSLLHSSCWIMSNSRAVFNWRLWFQDVRRSCQISGSEFDPGVEIRFGNRMEFNGHVGERLLSDSISLRTVHTHVHARRSWIMRRQMKTSRFGALALTWKAYSAESIASCD